MKKKNREEREEMKKNVVTEKEHREISFNLFENCCFRNLVGKEFFPI